MPNVFAVVAIVAPAPPPPPPLFANPGNAGYSVPLTFAPPLPPPPFPPVARLAAP